jgi:hypothetical protein
LIRLPTAVELMKRDEAEVHDEIERAALHDPLDLLEEGVGRERVELAGERQAGDPFVEHGSLDLHRLSRGEWGAKGRREDAALCLHGEVGQGAACTFRRHQ